MTTTAPSGKKQSVSSPTRLTRLGRTARAGTVPSFIICGASPIFVPLFAAAGLAGLSFILHRALWILAPLNLAFFVRNYRYHRNRAPLVLGLLGTLSIWIHLTGHNLDLNILPLIWTGIALLLTASALDVGAQKRYRQSLLTETGISEYWRAVLNGDHPGLRRGRRFYRMLPKDPRCKLCSAPFAGPGSVVARLAGKGRSANNPNFCADCLAKTPVGGAEVEISLLFADIRGSTTIAENVTATEFAALLNRFYAAATRAVLKADGLLDKFVGDEAIGLFVPGYAGENHAARAIEAAKGLLEATGHKDPDGPWVPVGAGVHTGTAFVGMVGSDEGVTEMTALGDAVNTTARLASAAQAGEVIASEQTLGKAGIAVDEVERRDLKLKGRAETVPVRIIRL